MEKEKVLKILGALAAGIDPVAGDFLPSDHVLQQPDVIRALHEAFAAVQHKRAPRQVGAPAAPRSVSRPTPPESVAVQGSLIPLSKATHQAISPKANAAPAPTSTASAEKDNTTSLTAWVAKKASNACSTLLGRNAPAPIKRKHNQRWTREDAIEAKRAFLAGEAVSSIGDRMGYDRAQVLSLFKYMDLISEEEEARGVESYPRVKASVSKSA